MDSPVVIGMACMGIVSTSTSAKKGFTSLKRSKPALEVRVTAVVFEATGGGLGVAGGGEGRPTFAWTCVSPDSPARGTTGAGVSVGLEAAAPALLVVFAVSPDIKPSSNESIISLSGFLLASAAGVWC